MKNSNKSVGDHLIEPYLRQHALAEKMKDKPLSKDMQEQLDKLKLAHSNMDHNAIVEELYKDTDNWASQYHEELESEFHAVIKKFNLPMDREAIAAAGFLVERGQNELFMEDRTQPFSVANQTATITQHGKPVSRTISMNASRVDSKCLSPVLKALLISDGVLCEVLDDLKRMTSDATKTLQELLDAPDRGDFNCTEISVDPESHLINRVVCLGKEYKI